MSWRCKRTQFLFFGAFFRCWRSLFSIHVCHIVPGHANNALEQSSRSSRCKTPRRRNQDFRSCWRCARSERFAKQTCARIASRLACAIILAADLSGELRVCKRGPRRSLIVISSVRQALWILARGGANKLSVARVCHWPTEARYCSGVLRSGSVSRTQRRQAQNFSSSKNNLKAKTAEYEACDEMA